ncbi:hypothetical protein EAH76_06470 [Sphingomonas glacialis]|uniref:DUF6894 domain-containing protein n=2 Tax=Sphingomonas glacialis TaxID=658225 RepID=A0A502FXS7_9SPHN|nr:hypothetical protein EAH76_06470 [Sphingomonas glacialis]
MGMPRYFFHVLNQTSHVHDEVGAELSSIAVARSRASDAAGEILTSDLRDGKTDIVFDVQVEDDRGARVLTVHVVGTVETGAPTR